MQVLKEMFCLTPKEMICQKRNARGVLDKEDARNLVRCAPMSHTHTHTQS